MKILISTCNKYDHLVKGCCLMLNKYWPGQDIHVLGFRDIPGLPGNATVHRLAETEKEPWSTYLHGFLREMHDSRFVFLFDDYWLHAPVDMAKVKVMEDLVIGGVDKGDLSGNTLYFKHTTYTQNPDLVAAAQNAHYRSSTQPAIWSRRYMLKLMRPGWNPWQFELNAPAGHDGALIVGPRQQIYVYANVYYKGSPDPYMLAKLSDEDLEMLTQNDAMTQMPTIPEIQRLRAGNT